MAVYKFKTNISSNGLKDLAKQLEEYAYITLPNKTNAFIEELANQGIKMAYQYVHGEFTPCIEFRYEQTGNGRGQLIGYNTTLIHRVWYDKTGTVQKQADVSPILMAEWGAGKYANADHRGTFPGQKNAFKDVWAWYDSNGTKHLSTEDDLIMPTHPMHNAYIEMVSVCTEIARKVFTYE